MTSLGVIIGNRNFFPDHLVTESRNELLSIFKKYNIKVCTNIVSKTRYQKEKIIKEKKFEVREIVWPLL
mgnify:CR=1 FL=1